MTFAITFGNFGFDLFPLHSPKKFWKVKNI